MPRIKTEIKSIWIAAFIIIGGILLIAFNSQRIVVEKTAASFNDQQLYLVKESAKSVLGALRSIEITLRTASDIIPYSPEKKVLESLFNNQMDVIEAFFILNNQGNISAAYPETVDVDQLYKFDLKKFISDSKQTDDLIISKVAFFETGQERKLSFILGVRTGDFSGWLCTIPDFNAIKDKFVYPVKSGKTGYAWIIDDKGMLISHPSKEMEGRDAIEILQGLWPEYSSFNLETIINLEMTKGEEGSGEYTGWHFGEKKLTKKLIAYSPITFHNLSWSIGVAAPYREAMSALMESLLWPIVFSGIFIIVILSGALLLSVQEKRKHLFMQELTWSQEVFDGITDGISIVDRNYRVLMVNQAVAKWHGKQPEDFKGLACYKVFTQQDSLCEGCPARETFETGKPAFRERVSIVLGGRKFYFHLNAFPLKDKDGKTIRVAECVKDVTKEMALRSELIQHERKAMIVKMSAQVAHEIRNPLGSLTLNIDLLEDEIKSYVETDISEAQNLLDSIKTEIESLHKVLNEYLECTRFPKISPDKNDIHSIIEELFELLEEELRRKKIIFKTNFEYDLPFAFVDKAQIRRAFLNIIRNAVDSMNTGGVIEVSTKTAEQDIEIVFKDSGCGIPSQYTDRIFTPFFSLRKGGTGLGLSITQHIIYEHKGYISCHSIEGQGTYFTIRVPCWSKDREGSEE